MNIQSLNIAKRGIEKALGTLEAAVMDALWKSDTPLSARDVTTHVNKKKSVSFNAISTVLNRLEDKDLVLRHAQGKRYTFTPKETKQAYSRRVLFSSITSLFHDKELLSAAGLSGDATRDRKKDIASIEQLEALLATYAKKDNN